MQEKAASKRVREVKDKKTKLQKVWEENKKQAKESGKEKKDR